MKQIEIVLRDGIVEGRLMRELVCIIEGAAFLDQFPCLMEHEHIPRSYRLDSKNDWFAVLTKRGGSKLYGEPPVEHDTLSVRHRYHLEPLLALKPWLEYRFSPRGLAD